MRVLTLGEMLVEIVRSTGCHEVSGILAAPCPGGAPVITISALARLGVKAGIIGAVGNDAFGRGLLARLSQDGVEIAGVRRLNGQVTGTLFVTWLADGTRRTTLHAGAAAQVKMDWLGEHGLDGCAWFHLAGSTLFLNGELRSSAYLAAMHAKERGARISFTPCFGPDARDPAAVRSICAPVLRLCDFLFPTQTEAAVLACEEDADRACLSLLEQGPGVVALKCGTGGSRIFTRQGIEAVDAPAPKGPHAGKNQTHQALRAGSTACDSDAVGDSCYDAGFIYGSLQGWNAKRSAVFAGAMRALAAARPGHARRLAGLEEVHSFLANHDYGQTDWGARAADTGRHAGTPAEAIPSPGAVS